MCASRTNSFGSAEEFKNQYIVSDQLLGAGAFATVYAAKRKSNFKDVAIKIVEKGALNSRALDNIKREINILKDLNHPNVVQMYDAFEGSDKIYIVMELIFGVHLEQLMKQRDYQVFSEAEARNILFPLAKAMQYCNSKGVVHRDLKLENVMVVGSGPEMKVKIVDFNLSNQMDKELITHILLETECGTVAYTAPEILNRKDYNFKCDVWSLGVIAFTLLSLHQPFENSEDEDLNDVARRIKNDDWYFSPAEAWVDVSREAKDLIEKMIEYEPEARIDYSQMLAHPWFKADKTLFPRKEDLKKRAEHRHKLEVAGLSKLGGDILAKLMESDRSIQPVSQPGDRFSEEFFT